eukprot:2437905-Amphidinium_carterae.1
MCELTARIEQAINGGDALYLLALDASKCFDRINHVSVLEAGRDCGIPCAILGTLGAFYSNVIRFMSAASAISSNGIHPTNGIPQVDRRSLESELPVRASGETVVLVELIE